MFINIYYYICTTTTNKIYNIMKTYNFNRNANKEQVKLHYKTLCAGFNYYKSRNIDKANEVKDEINQMKAIYKYL